MLAKAKTRCCTHSMKQNSTIWDAKPGRDKEKTLERKVLYPVIPALGPGPMEREGRDFPMAAPSFLPVIPHLALPCKKGHRAVRLGRMGKQGRARGLARGMRFPWKG